MTAVLLPTRPQPVPAKIAWSIVDFGGTLLGELGGMAQRVNRQGNRWRVELPLPAMEPGDARIWCAKLNRGLRLGVRWQIIQTALPTGSPGTPLVDGAGQAGTTLDCDGFNRGYVARIGQKFSIVTGGQRFVHEMAETCRAAADGTLTLDFEPPLRVSPGDDAVIEFGLPFMEGLLDRPATGEFDADRLMRGLTIAIEETR